MEQLILFIILVIITALLILLVREEVKDEKMKTDGDEYFNKLKQQAILYNHNHRRNQ